MATLLLIVIYIAFIGLGIPDSLFGTAWPAVYPEFGVSVSSANFVTVSTTACTVVCSLVSARIINRFGTYKVCAVSTAMTALALFGYMLSPNLLCMCLLAIPLGFGGGCIDTALNDYVALHYNASQMSFLHCFFGIGISISPYLMSLALAYLGNWRYGYRYAAIMQVCIAAIMIFSMPLWKKVKHQDQAQEEEITPVTLSFAEVSRIPGVRTVWLIFFASCGLECTCGTWGSTFLVNARGMSVDAAARTVMFYYVGMAAGRFLSGVLAKRFHAWQIIKMGLVALVPAMLLLLLPLPSVFAALGLFLIGLGNGPLFPNLIHLTPENFGKIYSQSIIGTQMASAYVGILLMPLLFGLLAQHISINLYPWYLTALFVLMAAAVLWMLHYKKQDRRNL